MKKLLKILLFVVLLFSCFIDFAEAKPPLASIVFLDGLASPGPGVPGSAVSLLERYGFRGTFYIPTSYMGAEGHLDPMDLRYLISNKHEVGPHSRSHVRLSGLSSEALRDEIQGSHDDLVRIHAAPAAQTFAYPYEADEHVRNDVLAVYAGAIGIGDGDVLNNESSDFFNLGVVNVNNETPLDEIRGLLTEAISKKAWVIFAFHGVDEQTDNSISLSNFKKILIEIRKSGIRVVTVNGGLYIYYDWGSENYLPLPPISPTELIKQYGGYMYWHQ